MASFRPLHHDAFTAAQKTIVSDHNHGISNKFRWVFMWSLLGGLVLSLGVIARRLVPPTSGLLSRRGIEWALSKAHDSRHRGVRCTGTRCRFNGPLAAKSMPPRLARRWGIARIRSSLLAEHLVVSPDRINEVHSTTGSLIRTVDALRTAGSLPGSLRGAALERRGKLAGRRVGS